MAHNADKTVITSATKPERRVAAAERMRLHRRRQRDGLRCVIVEVRESEVSVLIRIGLLAPETRHDPHAVRRALHAFFDLTLSPEA